MNILIIGAGPAGEAAAKTLRKLDRNAAITVVEKEHAGGLCLNKGCIPSKTLLEHVRKESQAGHPINWTDLQAAKTQVVTGIRSALEGAFKSLKISLVRGQARFTGPKSVEVTGSAGAQTHSFDKALICTGTEILYPPPLDAVREQLLNSDRMLETMKTPASVIVVGGGAIGCEFACLLNAAGAKVTIIELKPGLLPGEDDAVVQALTRSFEERGIDIRTGVKVAELSKTGSGWSVKLSDGHALEAEQVLACVGRVPVHGALGLENAGVKLEKGQIVLNERMQTTNPDIFAAGDAATTRLAHAAASQAEVAAHNLLGGAQTYDDRFVPRCLYSWPEVASVGQWKYQLEEKNQPVKASRAFFKGSARALAAGEADGFVQIVSDPDSKKILGAQIIGPHATELIHVFSIALKAGLTTAQIADVMFAHPTLSEVIKEAAKK